MNKALHKAAIAFLVLSVVGCEKKEPPPNEMAEKPETAQTPSKNRTHVPSSPDAEAQKTAETAPPVQSFQARRENIAAEIVAIVGRNAGELTVDQWRQIKARYWCLGFDQALYYGSSSASVKDLIESNSPKELSLIEQLATGNFVSVSDQNEQQALIAFHLLAMTTAGGGGRTLPAAINDRINQVTPTSGDFYLFEIFNDAFVEVNGRRELDSLELAAWQTVASSLNPIYRLLALRNFCNVSIEQSQWLDFYSLYVDEKDPMIVSEVVELAVQSARPDASKILTGLKTNANVSNDPDLRSRIDRSIEWLETLPAPTSNSR